MFDQARLGETIHRSRKRHRSRNIDESKRVTPGPTPGTLRVLCADGVTACIIDAADFENLKSRGLDHWHVHHTGRTGHSYPRCSSVDLRTGVSLVSRLIMDAMKGDLIGHRNHNPFDLTRANLYFLREGYLRKAAKQRALDRLASL